MSETAIITASPRKRRLEILEFIQNSIESNGVAPTIAEIGTQFSLSSPATVHKILVHLENDGLIERSRAWRGIRVIR